MEPPRLSSRSYLWTMLSPHAHSSRSGSQPHVLEVSFAQQGLLYAGPVDHSALGSKGPGAACGLDTVLRPEGAAASQPHPALPELIRSNEETEAEDRLDQGSPAFVLRRLGLDHSWGGGSPGPVGHWAASLGPTQAMPGAPPVVITRNVPRHHPGSPAEPSSPK